jgi:hypothetical protein
MDKVGSFLLCLVFCCNFSVISYTVVLFSLPARLTIADKLHAVTEADFLFRCRYFFHDYISMVMRCVLIRHRLLLVFMGLTAVSDCLTYCASVLDWMLLLNYLSSSSTLSPAH